MDRFEEISREIGEMMGRLSLLMEEHKPLFRDDNNVFRMIDYVSDELTTLGYDSDIINGIVQSMGFGVNNSARVIEWGKEIKEAIELQTGSTQILYGEDAIRFLNNMREDRNNPPSPIPDSNLSETEKVVKKILDDGEPDEYKR